MHSGKLIYEVRCIQGSDVEILWVNTFARVNGEAHHHHGTGRKYAWSRVRGIDSVVKGRVLPVSPSPGSRHHNFCQIGAFTCSHVPQTSSTAAPFWARHQTARTPMQALSMGLILSIPKLPASMAVALQCSAIDGPWISGKDQVRSLPYLARSVQLYCANTLHGIDLAMEQSFSCFPVETRLFHTRIC